MSIPAKIVATRAVTSYLPAVLTREIAQGSCRPESRDERLRGSVMFVDMAGFTPFVLSLCSLGQKGIEALQGVLTRYFDELVDCIYDHGGDVYHFAGDSMLIGFSGMPSEPDNESAARAVACAISIREIGARYEDFDVLGTKYRMDLKIGLAFGDYHYVLIGQERFWFTPLIIGKPVDEAIDAERNAKGGDILVDDELWARIPPPKEGTRVDRFVRLDAIASTQSIHRVAFDAAGPSLGDHLVEQCAHFIEPVLYEKAATGLAGFEADFREVTCLFVRYGGLRLDGDVTRALSVLNELYGFVQESASTYRAVINRVELGDKGLVFLFILGAPKAMESKCTLASRLAMKLTRPPEIHGITTQAGIATGYGFCGDVGAPYRKEYTVTGEVVNLAARLMTYAEAGGVYLDECTRSRIDRRLVATEIPGVALKGMPDAVTIYRLHSEGRHHRDTGAIKRDRLVGREEELETLSGLYHETRLGLGHICLVTGEAGVGKSRLAADFLDRVGPDEASVFTESCYAHEQFTPYSVWKALLRDFLGIPDDVTSEEACTVIVRQLSELDGVSRDWTPVIAQSLGLSAREGAFTRSLEPAQKTRRIFQIICQLVERRASFEPLVFCIDDLHWSDDVSLRLIEHLAARLGQSSVLFMLLSRELHAESSFAGLAGFHRLTLTGLAPSETHELLQDRLEHHEPHPDLERMILERAEGNPFFVESILQSLREQELLSIDKTGRVTLAGDASQLQIPESLQDLILTRIDRLDENEKTTLRIASVIGRVFASDILQALLPLSIDSPLSRQILARLEGSGFVISVSDVPERFQFRHVLIADVAYATLPL
ncbi:MAG: AAA family ATPase, partial [Rhodothermales bacterium]|nr:AAA family ATPase [Rhodothermales bacterium]